VECKATTSARPGTRHTSTGKEDMKRYLQMIEKVDIVESTENTKKEMV